MVIVGIFLLFLSLKRKYCFANDYDVSYEIFIYTLLLEIFPLITSLRVTNMDEYCVCFNFNLLRVSNMDEYCLSAQNEMILWVFLIFMLIYINNF